MISRFASPILLGVFVLLASAYSVIIPLGEAPDEVPHWSYIQELVEHQRLPPPEGAVAGESHQPPLYYLISAAATAWIPRQDFQVIANPDFILDDPQTPNLFLHPQHEAFPYRSDVLAWHLTRLLSIAMGVVTVWATWQIAREIFPDDEVIAWGAAAFVAFLPGFVFISAVVNNDNLITMLASLVILHMVRIQADLLGRRDLILLGITLGLAALTKLSAFVVWLFAAGIFGWRARKSGMWNQVARESAVCFGIAVMIILPWVAYNLRTYGDPFAYSAYLATGTLRENPLTWREGLGIARELFTSFWGRFGGATQLEMSSAVYQALALALVLPAVGWIRHLQDMRNASLNSSTRTLIALSILFWLPFGAAYVQWSLQDRGVGQARLLFPGLSLLAIFFAAGLARLVSPSNKKIAIGVWAVGLSMLNLVVLFYIQSVYVSPLRRLDALPTLGGTKAPIDFGNIIRVVDYRVGSLRAHAGDSIAVQIYWQALTDPKEDYWFLLKLEGRNGAIAQKDGVPSAGRVTTDWWRKGDVFESRHTIQIPKDVQPGIYSLSLGLHPFGKWEWLPVRGQEMQMLGSVLVVGK